MKDSTSMTAAELKEHGNRLFTSKHYAEAIKFYTQAINKNSLVSTFFTNRALCHLKMKEWDLATSDCKRALDLDPSLVKGHFFLGQSLVEQNLYDEAIASLQRAYDLAREQKLNFGDDIACALRTAKKKVYYIGRKRIGQEIELQTYLNRLVLQDRDRNLKAIQDEEITDESSETKEDGIKETAEQRLKEVNDVFAQVDDRRRKRDIPDYLCGKISFELMKDPVITPSGITYDKSTLKSICRVGHFDPVTRADLKQDQLIPNLAMKEVIDAFVTQNEWVLEEW